MFHMDLLQQNVELEPPGDYFLVDLGLWWNWSSCVSVYLCYLRNLACYK